MSTFSSKFISSYLVKRTNGLHTEVHGSPSKGNNQWPDELAKKIFGFLVYQVNVLIHIITHHVAYFGILVIHLIPDPTTISPEQANTEILIPKTMAIKIKLIR